MNNRKGWRTRADVAALILGALSLVAALLGIFGLAPSRKSLSGPVITSSGSTDSAQIDADRLKVLEELISKETSGRGVSSAKGRGAILKQLIDERDLELEIANLRKGNLAYNAPERMKTGQTFRLMARIGSDSISVQTLQSGISVGPNIKTETISTPVTTKMKMTLKGSEFDITPLSSEEQFVAGNSPTTWEWDIAPKHAGTLGLHLAAVVELNGMSKDYQTVDRNIAVQVDPVDASEKFLKQNWQWILTALGLSGGGGGVLAFIRSRRKKAEAGTILMP